MEPLTSNLPNPQGELGHEVRIRRLRREHGLQALHRGFTVQYMCESDALELRGQLICAWHAAS